MALEQLVKESEGKVPLVQRIADHARSHITHSKATEALFLVHPYFPKITLGSAAVPEGYAEFVNRTSQDIKSVIARTGQELEGGFWNLPRKRSAKKEIEVLQAIIEYLNDASKLQKYVERVEAVVRALDTSKVRIVVVEKLEHYFEHSHLLVESGRVNSVMLTNVGEDEGTFDLVETVPGSNQEIFRTVKTAYIGGSYTHECVLSVAGRLYWHNKLNGDRPMKVRPVTDLLFAWDNRTEEVLRAVWEPLSNVPGAYRLAIHSSKLPKNNPS